MNYQTKQIGKHEIGYLPKDAEPINSAQMALELLVNLKYQGISHLVLQDSQLDATFFDLKSGLAGEILQKFSNYGGYLAVLGDFSQLESKSLRDFMSESNRLRRILFVGTEEQAFQIWTLL